MLNEIEAVQNALNNAHEMTYISFEDFVNCIDKAGFTEAVCDAEFKGVKYEDIDITANKDRITITMLNFIQLIDTKSKTAEISCL